MPSESKAYVGTICFLAGFFVGGPANIVSSAISADLGTHASLKDNPEALATVAGIIDGTGSVGAAIVQALVSFLTREVLFIMLALLLFASAALIIKLFLKDIKDLRIHGIQRNQHNHHISNQNNDNDDEEGIDQINLNNVKRCYFFLLFFFF